MSFVGDLEHLPIVDIIQLLHSTRKTGTLCLKSHKGASQLVFKDGYIVSANHVKNSVRIGQILLEMKAITEQELEQALAEQKNAGANRRPLIATLFEGGKINKDVAYNGLETLIQMTIVEVLTWSAGTFELDVNCVVVSDEYRYFPETLKQDLLMNTQSVLMDALRIYDEKMRDGTLTDDTFSSGETNSEETCDGSPEGSEITADDLGLSDLDNLERKIPDVFQGLKDHSPDKIHRQKIGGELKDIPCDDQEKIFSFLMELAKAPKISDGLPSSAGPAPAVIVFSQDELIKHTILTVCKHEGFLVFTTDEEVNLDLIIDQSLSKGLAPVLVIDSPKVSGEEGFASAKTVGLVQQKREKYPLISIIQLVSPSDYDFSLLALKEGVRGVFPRPSREERKETFVEDTIKFLEAFRHHMTSSFSGSDQGYLRQFRDCVSELGMLKAPSEVAFVLLRFASAMFERAITFVVGKSELIAERGIGVRGEKGDGATPPLRFALPLAQPSIFRDVVEKEELYYGQSNDALLRSHLFSEIGVPFSSKVLLVPLKSYGRVIAIIYGDFGLKAGSPVQIELVDILARHAGLMLDNTLYRKRFDKSSQA